MKNSSFYQYFFKYIFTSKTRQRLILLSILALFLSSMSLLIVQSIMTGLQGNMIKKYKSIYGEYFLELSQDMTTKEQKSILAKIKKIDDKFVVESEIELLAKNKGQISPVILHGVEYHRFVPDFLKELDHSDIVLGVDLATKLKSSILGDVQFYSPNYTNDLFGDIPRFVSGKVSDLLYTGFYDIDVINAWVRRSLISNLKRDIRFNMVRFYQPTNLNQIQQIISQYPDVELRSWENENQELLWAFKLESTVMISLFICMSALVALTIVSAVLIFFNKIKVDLVSFWILGFSKKKIQKMMLLFTNLGSLLTCMAGLFVGTLVLLFLKHYSPNIMPDVFLERSLPVHFQWDYFLFALGIPYIISSVFCYISLKIIFNDQVNFISYLRKMGN
jgi:lipoprotein-releasing system permease protein